MKRLFVVSAALSIGLGLLGPAFAVDDAKVLSVVPDKGSIKYTLVHKAHTVVGEAKKAIEGKAKLQGGGVQLMVRVPVESFDSGNDNRDAHMKEAVEAKKYPMVELKAVAEGVTRGQTKTAQLKGKLTFHGETRPVEIPLEIVWTGDSAAHITAKFSISLEAYKVERPSLLFVKVEDKLDLAVDLQLQ